jgi:hypothetical protein
MSALKTTVLADGRIEVSGNTFPLREEIKAAAVAAGGKAMWDAGRKVWTVPAGTVVPVPAPAAVVKKAAKPKPKPRSEWSREEWQMWIAVFKSKNRGRVERCCDAARDVGDIYGPSCYSCERHGETHGSYRGD